MKNPKTLATVLGTLVLLAVGFLFFRGPKPIIEIKAEKLADIGPFPLVNTYVTSVTVVVVLIVVALLATRKINLIPSGLQNAVEAVMEALYNICISTAGEKNGRRFFPVVMTIFTFIWIANWMALLPFFNAIGSVQKVDAHHFHEEAVVFSKSAGISLIKPNQKGIEFEVDETEVLAVQKRIDEATAAAAPAGTIAGLEHEKEETELKAHERAFALQLPKAAGLTLDLSSCHELEEAAKESCEEDIKLAHEEEAAAKLQEDGKQIGILIPYFRSMNTDINSPLSIAIWAMVFIEFWGITALGVFKYAGKFFVNPISNPIGTVVGLLEFVAEIARLISFTFRLFGNMLAGEILLLVMTFLVPFVVALPFYALETFVGIIQAFVFAMLTLVFGTLAVASHDDHGDEHEEHDDAPHGAPAAVAAL